MPIQKVELSFNAPRGVGRKDLRAFIVEALQSWGAWGGGLRPEDSLFHSLADVVVTFPKAAKENDIRSMFYTPDEVRKREELPFVSNGEAADTKLGSVKRGKRVELSGKLTVLGTPNLVHLKTTTGLRDNGDVVTGKETEASAPKNRGRPAKAKPDLAVAPAVKRGRGRPRKNPVETTAITPTSKRAKPGPQAQAAA